jgi:hypothetical protein
LWVLGLIGTRVHQQIGNDFERKEQAPGTRFANYFSIEKILGINQSQCKPFPGACFLQPDLVDTLSQDVYEIKPAGTALLGAATLALELFIMNSSDQEKRFWHPGFTYLPPPVLYIEDVFGTFALVGPPYAGLITYTVINLPLVVSAICAYEGARMAQIQAEMGVFQGMGIAF